MKSQIDIIDKIMNDVKGKCWADIDEEENKKSNLILNDRQQSNGIQFCNSVTNETSSTSHEQ